MGYISIMIKMYNYRNKKITYIHTWKTAVQIKDVQIESLKPQFVNGNMLNPVILKRRYFINVIHVY